MISDRPGADTTVGGRLTPETVRRIDFPRTPLGRRGYHETDVERFRSRVVLEIVTANAEKAELRQEIQRLRDYYRRQGIAQQGGPNGRRGSRANEEKQPEEARVVPPPVTGQLSVDAVNVMSRAQQAADQHIAQAEEYARRLITTARSQYEEILVHAHDQAEKAAAEAADLIARHQARATTAETPVLTDGPASGAGPGSGGGPAAEGGPASVAGPASAAGLAAAGLAASAGGPASSAGDLELIDPAQAAHLLQLESRLTYMRTFAQVTQVQLRSILDALGEELEHLSVPVPD